MSIFGVILVRIFPTFSRIQTEYGEIRSINEVSLRIQFECAKMRTRITPNTDTFYAVHVYSTFMLLVHVKLIDKLHFDERLKIFSIEMIFIFTYKFSLAANNQVY